MKSPVVIELNGTVITGRIDGIESFELTLRQSDDDGVVVKSYSSEITFFDDGYNILKPILIDDPNGSVNEVDVKIYDECCGRVIFEGIIRGDSIDWCEPECWISAQVMEKNPALSCIKSRLIYDNELGFLNRPQKQLRYCVETRPDWILSILFLYYTILYMAFYLVLFPMAFILGPISIVVALVCQVVCLVSPGCTSADCISGTWTNPVNTIDEVIGFLQDFNNRLLTCQWYHPTALVRDYIKNVCDICGLEFESSILNDPSSPYYNLLLFSAPVRKGYRPNETNNLLITENLPIETVDTLMTRHLKPLFNAQYWIIGNKLIFERKDFFNGTATWLDSEAMLNDGRIIDNRICFSWIDEQRPAFGQYEYIPDGSDLIGNENRARYNEIVEWNSPPSDAQSDSLEKIFASSAARFRDDGAGDDTLAFYENSLFDFYTGNTISNSRDLLLLNQHTAFNYKFLIWDHFSGDQNARIKRDYSSSYTGGDVIGNLYNPPSFQFSENVPLPWTKLFNYPMWFNENNTGNLYTLFHYIDNPRIQGAKVFNFEFTFGFECSELDAFDFSTDIRIRVGSNVKFGQIKELKINLISRTITVSGIV